MPGGSDAQELAAHARHVSRGYSILRWNLQCGIVETAANVVVLVWVLLVLLCL